MSERKLAVSGTFYPDNKEELTRYIEHFNNVLDKHNIVADSTLNTRAMVVPHAGYIYSGFTANMAYKYISKEIKNIIVIGPSHKFAFRGASVALFDNYPTPFGELIINKSLSQELIDKFNFLGFDEKIHSEHSTETQFPFIKYYTNDVKVIEIVYGDCDFSNIAEVVEYLLESDENLVVVSTDLSHFYTLKEANIKDSICLEAIQKKDIKLLDEGCEACGKIGVKAMIKVANKLLLETKIIDYRTSADTSKDESSVVGYLSVIFNEKNH
jgi:hypothetical protein